MAFRRGHHFAGPHRQAGLTLPEVLVASALLSATVAASLQLTGTSLGSMGRSKQRAQVDGAIAAHMESLRARAFALHCSQGCKDDELTQDLQYNIATVKSLCASDGLGQSLLASLPAIELSPFVVAGTNPPVTVTPGFSASGNQLAVTFNAPAIPLRVASTLVPHAQGWCP
jgi:prepilin-type N-terminal cleavage/methylation domain-containing protein